MRRSTRRSNKQKTLEKEPIYEIDDVLAIYDEAYPDKFTFISLDEKVFDKDTEIEATLCIRGDKPNEFYFADEQKFDQKDILSFVSEARTMNLRKAYTVSDLKGKSFDSESKLKLRLSVYKKLVAMAENFKAKSEEEIEEDEEEEEELASPVKIVKKVKKIIGSKKKASPAASTQRTKKAQTKAAAKAPKAKPGKKKKPEKYKKGKWNPFVTIRDHMEQLDNDSEIPNLDNSVTNNNREIIRAAKIGSIDMFHKILYSNQKISRISETWGIDNTTSALSIAMENGDEDFFVAILNSMDPDHKDHHKKEFTTDPVAHINRVETGFNDKYAYGVRTRAVNMSRGNRQGNNAFTQDASKRSNTIDYRDCQWMMSNNKISLKQMKLVMTYFPNLRAQLLRNISEAILIGNNEKAAYFIKENLKRDQGTFNKFHRLALTCKSGKGLRDMQKRNATKMAQGVGGYSPIHCACINPNVEVLKHILSVKPEYNNKDRQGRKPVHYAACCSGTGPLLHLMANNVDTRDIDLQKKSPLMYACRAGRIENVKILLGPNRSNLEAKDGSSYNAIHYAAEFNHPECVEALVKAGADINKGGPHRKTALHIAASKGNYEMCEVLIEAGARRTSKDKFKRTALVLAVMNGSLKCASLLLKYGAPFDCPDSSDNYPLHYACAYGYPELIDLLIEAGCDPNKSNSWKYNPTTIALLKNYFECVKKMLDFPQTDVNCIDNDGRTLLSNTVKNITPQSFKNFLFLLEEKSACPNFPDKFGLSTLHHLCRITTEKIFTDSVRGLNLLDSERKKKKKDIEKLYKKFFKTILDHNADINLKNKDGLPPIFLALRNKNVVAVELLLNRPDIDLNLLTNDNESIFHYLTDVIEDEKFVKILEKIIKKINKVDILLNKIADTGYNAVQHIVKKFVENHNGKQENLYQQYRNELVRVKKEKIDRHNLKIAQKAAAEAKKAAKKAAKKTKGGKKGLQSDSSDSEMAEEFTGLKGGARTKTTARRSAWGKRPRKVMSRPATFSNPSIAYQNTNIYNNHNNIHLTETEEKKMRNRAEQKFTEITHQFIDVLTLFKNSGADFHMLTEKPVEKKEDLTNQQNQNGGLFGRSAYGGQRFVKMARKSYHSFGGAQPVVKKASKETPEWVGSSMLHLIAASPNCTQFYNFFIEEANVKTNQKREDGKTELQLYMISHPGQIDISIFEYLLAKGNDINTEDKNLERPIHYACNSRNMNYLNKLLELEVELDVRSKKGETPLLILTKARNLKLVQRLIDAKCSINFSDNDGRSALHWAVNNSSASSDATNELENLLLSSGIDANSKDKRDRVALHYAFVKVGNPFMNNQVDPIETVSNILSRPGADVSAQDQWGYSPLHYAAQRGSVISALYLIRNGAEVNSKNEHGNTPLNICLLNNHKDMAIFLIQKDADLSVPVKVVTVKMLKEKVEKEELEKRENERKEKELVSGEVEAEYMSSDSGEGSDSEEEEEEEKAQQQAQGGFGRTRRKTTKKRRTGGLFGRSNNFGNNNNQPEMNEDELDFTTLAEEVTAFMIAIRRNWQGIAFLMLEYGFDLSIAILDCFNAKKFNYVYTLLLKKSEAGMYQLKNKLGQNISHLFCKYSGDQKDQDLFDKIYEKIKSKGIDFSLVDSFGKNCLHYASESGCIKLISNLLELGLNINERDRNGDTPLSLFLKGKNYVNLKEFIPVGLKYDIDINQTFPYRGVEHRATTYCTVAERCNYGMVYLLHNEGKADINLGTSRGWSPLILMIKKNDEIQAEHFWKETKPDLTLVDNDGRNIIHHIVKPLDFGYYQNVALLKFFGKKADINLKDNSGNPPIYYAGLQSNNIMKKALIRLKANEIEIEENSIEKVKSSLLNDFQFPEVKYNFEEDYQKFNEECLKKQEASMALDEDTKVKPFRLVSGGDYEVIYNDKDPYNLFMVKVEISRGCYSGNTFYRMQLLRDKVRGVIVLFTNWGRNGTDGQYQHTPFGTLELGVAEFEKIFKQKSANQWKDKENFQKRNRKYRLVTYNPPNKGKNYLKPINYKDPELVESTLEKTIFKFIRRLCNSKIFLQSVSSYQLDTELLPVRNLTRDRIEQAQAILVEIQDIMAKRRKAGLQINVEAADLITDLTNEYYELLPTNQYKNTSIPPITSQWDLSNKIKMINDLLYSEVVIKLLCGAQFRIKTVNPIDYCFNSLSFKIQRVSHEKEEYTLIKNYIKSGYTQTQLPLKKLIANIYAVERRNERENIQEWEEFGNKMLLWHGTKAENVVGILQTGFRIAPPDSSRTGAMFGDGIYFADLFSKSYNYTHSYNRFGYNRHTNQKKKAQKRYMLLCEVALGKQRELSQAQVVKSIPSKKYQSVKGIGRRGPDFANSIYLSNGCMVPSGPQTNYPLPTKPGVYYGLNHNEYVVYDETQVRIKYVVELRSPN